MTAEHQTKLGLEVAGGDSELRVPCHTTMRPRLAIGSPCGDQGWAWAPFPGYSDGKAEQREEALCDDDL